MFKIQRPALSPMGYRTTEHPSVSTCDSIRRKYLVLILSAAFLVNLAIVLLVLPQVSSPLTLTYSMNFGDLYDLIAKNIDHGNGYRVDAAMGRTMLREPGYPLFLATVFKIGGYGIQQARLVCALLAFGAAFMLLKLGKKITGDAMTGVLAAIIFLLYPGILVAEARAGIEIPSIFTVLLFMLALYSAVERGSLWRYFAAGLLLGVAVLVRSEVLLFPSFLLVYLLLTARSWVERRRVIGRIAVLAAGAVIVMSPWIIRNYLLVHEFVPTATVAGVAAQEGLYTCETATPSVPFYEGQVEAGIERERVATSLRLPFVGPYYQLFYTPHDEVAFNHALLNHVSTEYRTHPSVLARCAAKNVFFNFWFLGKRPTSTWLNVIVQAPLLALAFGGIMLLWKRGLLPKAGIILLYIVYIPVLHAPIIAHARHSMLIAPFLAILASTCVVWIWRELKMGSPAPASQKVVIATVK